MKKLIIGLVIVATVGFIAIQVSACMWDGYYGGGPKAGNWGGYALQGNADQDFLNETTQLRQDLAAKRGEYNALMAQPSPDPKRAAKLSQEITVLHDRFRAKAHEKGYSGPGRRGGHYQSQMGSHGYCDSRAGWRCW